MCRDIAVVCIATCMQCFPWRVSVITCIVPSCHLHFGLRFLLQMYPLHSPFRHIHVSQGLSCPLAKSSCRFMMRSSDLAS